MRGYRLWSRDLESRRLLPASLVAGTEIFICRVVYGGVRDDVGPEMRGIAVIIIVKSVKRYIA